PHGTTPGGAPTPLPVRGAHEERPNPAEAVPGIRPDDRHLVADHATAPPTPRTGTVRGTMGRPPQLPRRRAQEHIAPQLRDGPAPRQDADQVAGHDPGLMAAFQRGIGLAEAQQHLEADHTGAEHTGVGHMSAQHMEHPLSVSAEQDRPTSLSSHLNPHHATEHHVIEPHATDPHTTAPHGFPTARLDGPHTDVGATPASRPRDVPPTGRSPLDASPMDPAHIAQARPASARGTDHPTRHDGSAPAG
ncbi:ATP-binding protein, partial [Streptomyces panaciradicis]|nr:ATP-binding protein [Streptomyces panaciradicis]